MAISRGKFITFEGVDGSGKTYQVKLLEEYLQRERLPYIITREPGGTDIGIEIRGMLDFPRRELHKMTRALLYQADRAQHIAEIIEPALAQGLLVISDRYIDSSIVYQQAEGIDSSFLEFITGYTCNHILPDMTFLLDLPIHIARERKDDYETSDEKYKLMRELYLNRASFYSHRFYIIDAMSSAWIIHNQIVQGVDALLSRKEIGI